MDNDKMAKRAIFLMLTFVSALLVSVAVYLNTNYQVYSFDQYLYSLLHVDGTSLYAVTDGFKKVILSIVIIMTGVILITYLNDKSKKILEIKIGKKNKKIHIFPLSFDGWTGLIILFGSIMYFSFSLGIVSYLINKSQDTTIYEDYYVDPQNVNVTFGENKRNLIYIYLESFESTFISSKNGGNLKQSYIPNLEKLALNNLNFSNTNNIGGAYQLYGTGWTVAAMVAHMGGIPLNVETERNEYGNYSSFLPGAYMLGDILEKEGYKNYFMIGSEARFGGRDGLVESHGNYEIYDYFSARNRGKISPNYYVWWGYEDKKLYNYAKEQLTKLASEDNPFNFTMLTADTHFTDGYLDSSCSNKIFDSKYANVYHCSDNMLNEFVNWITEQPFYENTTVVLVGDHLTMQSLFYGDDSDYKRTVFNTYMNSAIEPINSKNRLFSTFDYYPTTLASLGATIEGNRLGFGTNLFSSKQTLVEELGEKYLNNELSKNSDYYNNNILQDSYYEIKENNK